MKWFMGFMLCLVATGLAGCNMMAFSNSTYDEVDSTELACIQDEDNRTVTYKLSASSSSQGGMLVIKTEQVKERPDLGLTLKEIDKELAQDKLLKPYNGLFVQRVAEDRAAARGGILPGDILLRMNGVELMYLEQYDHLLRNNLDPEKGAVLSLLRGFENKSPMDLEIVPDMQRVTVPTTRAIPLEGAKNNNPAYAGIAVCTLPAEWTEAIYKENRSTVLITLVEVGSPAYLAGMRPGDRVLSMNGNHFETATQLYAWIQERGPMEETVPFEVAHKKGILFRGDLRLKDYSNKVGTYFPLVIDLGSNPTRTELDLGPWGLISSYSGTYLRDRARDPNYRRSFSCILGLYKRSWGPRRSSTRLLWFFKFGSDKN